MSVITLYDTGSLLSQILKLGSLLISLLATNWKCMIRMMGNYTGAGLGATIGLIGGPIGTIIGAIVGAIVGGIAEIINGLGAAVASELHGNGGYQLDSLRPYENCRILWFKLVRCNAASQVVNNAVTIARIILAPTTTINSGFIYFEHHFIIMKLDNGLYITTYKDTNGIQAEVLQSYNDCFIPDNCGALDKGMEVLAPRTQDCRAKSRKVIEFINKAESLSSCFWMAQFKHNCQGYAEEIRAWC